VTLRRARERKAMSVHDLATLTRISARWIAALEQERFEQLPATVFVVGYVRNLARALGVDPSDLLSRYRAQRQTQDAALLTAASGGDRFETAMRQRKYLVFTVLAVAVGLLALLGLLLQRRPG
jgi:cytoskeleton protein RodZ